MAAWLREVSQYRNVFADYQIIHFYRWLRSPHALLYDPALRKTLLNLMKKLFMQLVAEFKRLGAVVVHAEFNRVIICTKKRSVEDAIAYVDYVTSTIRSKELFHSIDMKMTQAWDFLLWCDPSNFGGVRSRMPKEVTTTTTASEAKNPTDSDNAEDEAEHDRDQGEGLLDSVADDIDDEEDDAPEIEMNWNLATYLPEAGACQKNFNTVIAGYITANHNFIEEEAARVAPGSTPIRRRRGSQSQTPARRSATGSGGTPQTASEFAQDLITGELAQRLFGVTQKIFKKLPIGEDEVFPTLPGSHLRLTNPSLEFVKALCKVLSLDSAITDEVSTKFLSIFLRAG